MNDGNFGLYYRATIDRTRCWYFVAILRSFEHMVFDRTYDVQNSVFEFFVPELMNPIFAIDDYF